MVQESEVVRLAQAIQFTVSVVALHRAIRLPRLPFIYAGAFLLVCANVFTVVEGLVWFELFNSLEHVCYATAGILFAVGCWSLATARADGRAES